MYICSVTAKVLKLWQSWQNGGTVGVQLSHHLCDHLNAVQVLWWPACVYDGTRRQDHVTSDLLCRLSTSKIHEKVSRECPKLFRLVSPASSTHLEHMWLMLALPWLIHCLHHTLPSPCSLPGNLTASHLASCTYWGDNSNLDCQDCPC